MPNHPPQFNRPALTLWRSLGTLLVVFGLAMMAGVSCSTPTAGPGDWMAWQARRTESIGGTNGWTTLIGLHWLNEGDNTAGGNPTNQIVLGSSRLPSSVGVFRRQGRSVVFQAAQGVDVRVNGQAVSALTLISDADTNRPTRLEIGLVSIVVIQRGERTGLRVRDVESEVRRHFQGIRWFPYNPAWRLEGEFVPYPVARTLRVADVTGGVQEFVSPGELVFKVGGMEYRLSAAEEPDEPEFFILFKDATSGASTYQAGRFLQVERPKQGNRVLIDFNRAYTPPCGYTAFATCPLPPRQNWLPLTIKAGELTPVGSHH